MSLLSCCNLLSNCPNLVFQKKEVEVPEEIFTQDDCRAITTAVCVAQYTLDSQNSRCLGCYPRGSPLCLANSFMVTDWNKSLRVLLVFGEIKGGIMFLALEPVTLRT